MELPFRKNGLPEGLVRAVMYLYKGSRTKVKVGLDFLKEFWVRIGAHQDSVLPPSYFAIVMYVVTEVAHEGLMEEV